MKTANDMTGTTSVRLPPVNDALRPLVADYLKVASDNFITPKFGNLQSADIGIKTGPYDLVTVADKEAESWLAPRLQDLQPWTQYGEEAVAETPEIQEHAGDGYVWSIDPIDGTNNFVNGVADFCSMVALMWDGSAIAMLDMATNRTKIILRSSCLWRFLLPGYVCDIVAD